MFWALSFIEFYWSKIGGFCPKMASLIPQLDIFPLWMAKLVVVALQNLGYHYTVQIMHYNGTLCAPWCSSLPWHLLKCRLANAETIQYIHIFSTNFIIAIPTFLPKRNRRFLQSMASSLHLDLSIDEATLLSCCNTPVYGFLSSSSLVLQHWCDVRH